MVFPAIFPIGCITKIVYLFMCLSSERRVLLMKKMKVMTSTIVLWVLSIGSVFLAVKTSDEPILEFFKNTRLEPLFQKLPYGNAIVFNFSVGFLVSIVFYLLVVWLPDRKRKNLIRKNMREQYRFFKQDAISILLSACQSSYESDLPRRLTTLSEFRKYFKEPVSESQDRWHVVLNALNDRLLADILVELEILRDEVSYVLNNGCDSRVLIALNNAS